jgi:C-terminal processing protease CtpA/Prc
MLTSMQRIIVMSAIAASLSSASLVGQQGINASNTTSPPAYNQDQQCSPRSRIGIIGVSAFVVKEAIKRGPAARAGITPGDIITEINGRQLSDEMSFQ